MIAFARLLFALTLLITVASCNDAPQKEAASQSTDSTTVGWNLGVALWTFHVNDFPTAVAQADSAGVKFVEPNTFHASGSELKDTIVGKLSDEGVEKLKTYLAKHNMQASSLYLTGGKTVDAWGRDFEIAKRLNVKFVTAEPPIDMWDAVDSIAGAYHLKVAIHEHWKGVSAYWSPDSVLAAIKGHPNFGACADLGHWPKSGIDPLAAIKKLEGHIIGVHLKDIAAYNDPKLLDVRVGTGVVPFPEIFKELKRQHFTGSIYIERDSQEVGGNLPSVIEAVKYHNDQVAALK